MGGRRLHGSVAITIRNIFSCDSKSRTSKPESDLEGLTHSDGADAPDILRAGQRWFSHDSDKISKRSTNKTVVARPLSSHLRDMKRVLMKADRKMDHDMVTGSTALLPAPSQTRLSTKLS